MINVTQESENTFTIEWDHEDPGESIFNSFTEQDFIEVLKYYAERSLSIDKYSKQSREESQETNYYNSESEGKDWNIYHKTDEASYKEQEIKVMNSRKLDMFPWVETFPYFMKDETENKKCWFTCEEHATKYIRRYNCKYKLYLYTGTKG